MNSNTEALEKIHNLDSMGDIIVRASKKRGINLNIKWLGPQERRSVYVRAEWEDNVLKKTVLVQGYNGPEDVDLHLQDRLMQCLALNNALHFVASSIVEIKQKIQEGNKEDLFPLFERLSSNYETHAAMLIKLQRKLNGDSNE